MSVLLQKWTVGLENGQGRSQRCADSSWDSRSVEIGRKHVEMSHCGTHGVCFSYPGLAIYVIYFVPLWLENHLQLSTYVRYFVPLRLENHTFIIHLCEIFCTLVVGKSYLRQPLMLDILYLGGQKIIPLSSTYVRDIVPLQLENHT